MAIGFKLVVQLQPGCWTLRCGSMAALTLAGALALQPFHCAGSEPPGKQSRSSQNGPAKLPSTNSAAALPAIPKPTPASRGELAVAFTRPVPRSLDDLRSMEDHVKALVARVSPAVVAVEVGDGSGSGVIIAADGLVMTAGHVCGAPNLDVRFTFPDGKTAQGKTLGVDLESDTGLMRITDKGPWPFVGLGDIEQTEIGDWVLALGHPGGFDLRRSLVVRLGRIISRDPGDLQTDCTISPGDSGGPLLDMYGRVIGIHSFISTSMADNYHVSIAAYYNSWEELVKITTSTIHAPLPQSYVGADGVDASPGCKITVVDKDGPASRAGLKVGDIVIKIEGHQLLVSSSFRRWIDESSPGETLGLVVKRGNKVLSLDVKLAEQPKKGKREDK